MTQAGTFHGGKGLILVVGPSGVGKDSILQWLAENQQSDLPITVAPRWCTRQSNNGFRHIPCTKPEFALHSARNYFALQWQANGNCYGIGSEILPWLQEGWTVLINGSREHATECLRHFSEAALLHITADPQRVAERLQQRGREDAAAIAARLSRQPALPEHQLSAEVHNDHSVAEAAAQIMVQLRLWRQHWHNKGQSIA